MPKSKTAPILVIIAGVLVAGAFAIYMSRQGSAAEKAGAPAVPASPNVGTTGQALRVRGAADAKITLVEFGDYQCPTCAQYHPIVMELLNRYAGKLKLEYHHFPLISIHPFAMQAAIAAEAAANQGKFWEMHDLLFERQPEWGDVRRPLPNEAAAEAVFLQYALRIGLDSNKFMQDLRSPDARDRVLADVKKGNPIVLKGTPTFILDGQMIHDLPNLEWFIDYIDRKLAATAQSSK
jgi:protein-disulfide isomerase